MSVTTVYPWGPPVFTASNYYTPAMGAAASSPPVAAIAGTVDNTGGTAIVGTGTAFTTALAVGQKVQFGSDTTYTPYTIASIADDTHLTLAAAYAGTTSATSTMTQYVAGGIAPLESWFHVGVQVTASAGCSVGYYLKAGSTQTLLYSYDGTTFASIGTLTADSRWHSIAMPSWPGGAVNVWLRTGNAGSNAVDTLCFNGDQFLTATDATAPSIAAVAQVGNAPPGTVTPLAANDFPGKVDAEGFVNYTSLGNSKTQLAVLCNSDACLRFKARCTDIWVLIYGSSATNWFTTTIDGVPSGIGATATGKVNLRNESAAWWYHALSGLDGSADHEYTINWGGTNPYQVSAVAVAGSFAGATSPARGTALVMGDSIMQAFTNPTEGFGYLISLRGYNVVNTGVFGALVQTGFQASPWPISLQFQAPQYGSTSPFYARPSIIVLDGGFNDAVHDASNFPAEVAHNRANFRATLTAFLTNLRAAFPTTKVVYLNLPPTTNSQANANRSGYNDDISTVLSGLADANLFLADISSNATYSAGSGATATVTVSGGVVTSISGTATGSNYPANTQIPLAVADGRGSGFSGYATTNGSGQVPIGTGGYTITAGGSGYTASPDVQVGYTYDGTHPNYNGYQYLWNNVISAFVPPYRVGAGAADIFGGGLVR